MPESAERPGTGRAHSGIGVLEAGDERVTAGAIAGVPQAIGYLHPDTPETLAGKCRRQGLAVRRSVAHSQVLDRADACRHAGCVAELRQPQISALCLLDLGKKRLARVNL